MRIRAFGLLVGCAFSTWAAADAIDAVATKFLSDARVPGMSIAIVRDGRTLKIAGYGTAHLEHNAPVGPDTVFEIGSVTKQFTATAILLLVEEKKVDLDAPISQYLDDLPEAWRPLTLRRLLNHTAGLPDYLATAFNQRRDWTPQGIVDLVKDAPLEYEPGTSWSYSNTGYHLAGMIIEKVSEKKYGEFLHERLFEPLGMTKTRMLSVSDVIPGRAYGYAPLPKGYMNAEWLRFGAGYAAGAMLSTARDMATWVSAMLDGKVLSPESYAELWKPADLGGGRTYPYGLGWMFEKETFGLVIEHGGNTYGQSAMDVLVPDFRLGIVVLTNRAGMALGSAARIFASKFVAEVRPPAYRTTTDPDRKTTFGLIDAFTAVLNGRFDSPLLAPEMVGLMKTRRGRMFGAGVVGQLGRLRTLQFSSRDEDGPDTVYRYKGVFVKASVLVELRVDSSGKLARVGLGAWRETPQWDTDVD